MHTLTEHPVETTECVINISFELQIDCKSNSARKKENLAEILALSILF